jgi:hypothetical protein
VDFDNVTALIDAGAPRVTSTVELAAAVDAVRAFGVDHVNFYNYSLVREETLDWIRAVTRGSDR